MKVVRKTEGSAAVVDYKLKRNAIIFGDDDLSVNLADHAGDHDVTLFVCRDHAGSLILGPDGAEAYVAELRIPAPFDIENCVLTLWEV